MTISLDRLPFDILFHIASVLDYDDIIHLGYTCHQLKALLYESTLCRKAIETHAPHSKEAQLARDQDITYSEALKNIYDRREAFSNAYPFSARVIGQGSAFTYRQGVLCVLDGNIIRVTNVHSSSESHEIDLTTFINSLSGQSSPLLNEPELSLLYYSDGIIAVHYEPKWRPSRPRVLAISTKADISESERLIKDILLESSCKLFVRHTSCFLYYGTYTGTGSHNHREWQIQGVSLDPAHPLPPNIKPVQLEAFFGADIGSVIAFEIHDGYFYAVSNQTSFDVEELDWTSFYHCVRFPLELPVKEVADVNARVYRRQHREGPIHDSWTDLTIQIDEASNLPIIVESRREWRNGSSKQQRTFYISAINFEDISDPATPDGAPLLPEDDQFTELLDSTDNPNYAPPRPRHSWEFHPEFPPNSKIGHRSFILARTKFRAYNYACSSFLDLVEDEKCCSNSTSPCLRIRIGSRRVAPLDWREPVTASSVTPRSASPSVIDNDVAYRHSKIKMWPPPAANCACSKQLHKILNPKLDMTGGRIRTVTGVVDERSLVYMAKATNPYSTEDNSNGVIFLINFSREVHDRVDTPIEGQVLLEDDLNMSWHWRPAGQKGQCC